MIGLLKRAVCRLAHPASNSATVKSAVNDRCIWRKIFSLPWTQISIAVDSNVTCWKSDKASGRKANPTWMRPFRISQEPACTIGVRFKPRSPTFETQLPSDKKCYYMRLTSICAIALVAFQGVATVSFSAPLISPGSDAVLSIRSVPAGELRPSSNDEGGQRRPLGNSRRLSQGPEVAGLRQGPFVNEPAPKRPSMRD